MRTLFFSFIIAAVFLAACSSSKENSETNKQNYVSEKIPPGTALVEAEVKSVEENSNAFELNVQIDKINGYGLSTKPIAPKTMMKINAAKTLFSGEQDKGFPKVGSVYELEISQPSKVMSGRAESNWNVNTINKIR